MGPIELSSGPESEKTFPSKTISISEEGLWGIWGGTEAFLGKDVCVPEIVLRELKPSVPLFLDED